MLLTAFTAGLLYLSFVFPPAVLAARGGPVAQSYSTLFLAAARNTAGLALESERLVYARSFGDGPVESSMPSTIDGSVFKQSAPITTLTPANARPEIVEYTVKPGDTPSAIAAAFGITTNTLFWANNLDDNQYIKPNDKLVILPVSGVRYKVKDGDNVLLIAKKFKGEPEKIITFNDLGPDGQILEGEYIIVPDGEMPRESNYRGYAPKYASNLQNVDDYFIHPTAGIGYKSRGLHGYNAVDIAASCWTPIYAAAEGEVALADGYGWNGGYGKYVKLNHPNGTRTIYAHAIKLQVSAGQYVKQGELIAYMGSTGRSTGCHVHWEVYGALNPLR